MEKYARKLKRFQYSNYGFSQTSQLLDLGSLQTSQSARKLKTQVSSSRICVLSPSVVVSCHSQNSACSIDIQLCKLFQILSFLLEKMFTFVVFKDIKVDAFTGSAFKGNPAVVCLLEENKDDQWLQVLAAEFNLSETCYLTWLTDSGSAPRASKGPALCSRFPVASVGFGKATDSNELEFQYCMEEVP
ncbi:hypothetical protein FF1_006864 [Malus domestica]